MNARARRRILLGWLPRGALVLTAALAPLIDRCPEEVARSGAQETTERVEAAGAVPEEAGAAEAQG